MNDLGRFQAMMNYQPVDHTPYWSWGGWPETYQRWETEGCDLKTYDPNGKADRRIVYSQWWFPTPPFEYQVLAEDEFTITYINHEGITMRERKDNPYSSMPQFIRFPVETREDFRAFWRERMQPDLSKRIGPDWRAQLIAARAQPQPLIIISDRWGGFFGPLRNMLGVQPLCTMFYDDPALIDEMMDANADLTIAIMDQVLDVVTIDAFTMWEDMAYKTAPLLSPTLARRHMLPRYRRVVDFLRGRGVQWIGLDSDGQIDPLMPVWLDAGLNFLYPFEVQSGMDVLAVRKKYGRELRIWGGVDKRVLAQGHAEIDAELARVRPLMEEGGYLPHTDHSVPPDVSFQNYLYFMQRFDDVCHGRG